MVLYQKYRPQQFDQLVGQDHVKTILLQALKQGRFAHGYLFAGPRGLGKTTTARLLAKALNCLKPDRHPICDRCASCVEIKDSRSLDVIEIDAASNRGIDEIRALREKIKFAPTAGRYKVYIIDEVHMLTKEAFSALLKTLEEPPAHAVFVLATTEPHKVPATIVSRVQRFDFKRPALTVVANWLGEIAQKEQVAVEETALAELARLADGSFRDALTLFEQVLTAGTPVTVDRLSATLGLPTIRQFGRLIEAIDRRDTATILALIDEFYQAGFDFGFLHKELVVALRNRMIATGRPDYAELIGQLVLAGEQSKLAPLPQIPLEVTLVRWSGKASGEPKPVQKKALTKEQWFKIVEATRSFNHSLAGILQESRLVNFKAGRLTIAVQFAFYKDRIEDPKNLEKIVEAARRVLGHEVVLICQLAQGEHAKSAGDDYLLDEAKQMFGELQSPESPVSTD